MIVINDGSRDRTVEVAKEAGAEKIVQFPANKGLALEIPKLIAPILDGKAEIVLINK